MHGQLNCYSTHLGHIFPFSFDKKVLTNVPSDPELGCYKTYKQLLSPHRGLRPFLISTPGTVRVGVEPCH